MDAVSRHVACGGFALFTFISTLFPLQGAGAQGLPELARNANLAMGTQGRLMWVDATANITRTVTQNGQTRTVDYTTTRAGVIEIVRRCKAAHLNTIVVDVKPLSGQVLYNSKVAPRMTTWKGRPLPDFDVLAAFVEEGHKAGLQVDACMNTLSEGHKLANVGLAYQHPGWQSVVYTIDRGMNVAGGARLSVRAPGEPDDATKPTLLAGGKTLIGDEPSGLTGLEGPDTGEAVKGVTVGQQINVVIDSAGRVSGMVDSALLGDDPLISPDGGRLITATRDADREWLGRNVKPGTPVRFDMRTGLTPITQAPSEKVSCFCSPLHPDVRKHELDVVRELVSNYNIDGLVLDRCRFSNLNNDFGDLMRTAFEQTLHHPVARWPQDIFAFSPTPGGDIIKGPLYKQWLEFRARIIRDLVGDIARMARSLKPNLILGTYVGSWYPAYYNVGVNWGSDKTNLRYSWFTADYPRTGYAEFFDWISTGCYYPVATRADARMEGLGEKATVEFAADLSNQAVANGAFVYPGVYVPDYVGRPDAFLRALEAAGRQGQGWMVFDLSYIDQYNWWPLLERAFSKDVPPPDRHAGLLSAVRSAMDGVK
jgi:uncharacterized lipoprotein YddW (UPF0748 family)